MSEPEMHGRNEPASIGVFIKNEISADSDSADLSALKSLFEITLATRNFEISQLVQRNNFFMIFQGVLFAGVVQSSHSKPVVSFLVCLIGFAVSVCQVWMAAGAKFWQEYWEEALYKVEGLLIKEIDGSGRKGSLQLFHDDGHHYEMMVKERLVRHGSKFMDGLILKRYSVSRVPIYVAIALSVVWGLLVLCTLRSYPPFSIPSFIVGF